MNQQVNKDKLVDKVRKLLALAGSSNEHEAARAAEKAQAILAEYNLSMTDVKSTDEKEDLKIDKSIVTDSVPWRRRLGVAVAQMYFCKYFYTFKKEYIPSRPNGYVRHDVHSFVGAEHNLVIAKLMFQYLNETIERLAKDGSMQYPTNERSSYRTSFKAACSLRVARRIHDRIEAAKKGQVKSETTGTNLPACLDLYEKTNRQLTQFIDQEVGKLKTAKSRVTLTHESAVRDGLAAGDKIGLDAQVTGKNSAHLLTNGG
jgi:Protein of unknown function (DUF2786)